MASPRTAWGAHDHDSTKLYKIKDGAPVNDRVGKAMRARIRQLCHVQFAHMVMIVWSELPQDRKDAIVRKIQAEFRPAPNHPEVTPDWIHLTGLNAMKHRRSDVRKAVKYKSGKPPWLDEEEWEKVLREIVDTPDRFQQQRDAASTRLQSAGTSHLGSGGYDTLRYEFVSAQTMSLSIILIKNK